MMSWCLLFVAVLSQVVIVFSTNGGIDGIQDDSCNATCTYTAWAQDANCRNSGLTVIPTDCGPSEMMDLRNNQLTRIQAGALGSYPGLRFLDLEFNQIGSVTAGAFAGCVSLENLYFQFNELAVVGEGAFEGATSLKRLFLNQNSMTSVHGDAFRALNSLIGLYMGNNYLRELEAAVFEHTPLLEFLHLGNNKLEALPDDIFRPLSRLTFLNLEENNLRSISASHFQPLGNLQELYLSGNQIVSVSHLPRMPSLNILDLSGNDIRDVGELAEKMVGLEQLYLGGNDRIDCTCSVAAVGEWIRLHKDDADEDAAKVNATCYEPTHLRGRALSTLTKRSLCSRQLPVTSIAIATYAPVKTRARAFHKKGDDNSLLSHEQGRSYSIHEEPTFIYAILGVSILIVIVLVVAVLIKCLEYRTQKYRHQNTKQQQEQQQQQQQQQRQQQRNAADQQMMVINRHVQNEDPLYEPVGVRPSSPSNDSAFGSEDDIAQAGRAQSMDELSFPIPPQRPDHTYFNCNVSPPTLGSCPPSEESTLLAQERPSPNPSRRGASRRAPPAIPYTEGLHNYPQHKPTSPYISHSMLRQKLNPQTMYRTGNTASPFPSAFTPDRTPDQSPDQSPQHIPNYHAPSVPRDQTLVGNERSAFLDKGISCV